MKDLGLHCERLEKVKKTHSRKRLKIEAETTETEKQRTETMTILETRSCLRESKDVSRISKPKQSKCSHAPEASVFSR